MASDLVLRIIIIVILSSDFIEACLLTLDIITEVAFPHNWYDRLATKSGGTLIR